MVPLTGTGKVEDTPSVVAGNKVNEKSQAVRKAVKTPMMSKISSFLSFMNITIFLYEYYTTFIGKSSVISQKTVFSMILFSIEQI